MSIFFFFLAHEGYASQRLVPGCSRSVVAAVPPKLFSFMVVGVSLAINILRVGAQSLEHAPKFPSACLPMHVSKASTWLLALVPTLSATHSRNSVSQVASHGVVMPQQPTC